MAAMSIQDALAMQAGRRRSRPAAQARHVGRCGLEVHAPPREFGLNVAGLFMCPVGQLLVFAAIAEIAYSPLAKSFGSKPLPCLSMK